MKILVTGGAGYIGSLTVGELKKRGEEVVVFDNLVYGHREALDPDIPLVVGDLLDKSLLTGVFAQHSFGAVIHFAAYAAAGESMENPYKYFHSNVLGSLNLLEVMKDHAVRKIVFSSSCTVYGQAKKLPVKEDSPIEITNVYGESKYAIERMLYWYQKIFGLSYASLRYFNAAGAALDGTRGEDHRPETHLIPVALRAALAGKPLTVFGKDYPTPDGTNIRDYIHVLDLAQAHLLSLDYLEGRGASDYFNLGVGRGYSNLEILAMIKKASGVDFPVVFGPRRMGDADAIYADNTKAREVLGWVPRYGLKEIVESAYLWHKSHPQGYG